MKKYIIIIMLLLLPATLFAYEEGPGFYAEYAKDVFNDITYTDIEVHYTIKFWQIELQPYGGTQTYFISNDTLIFGGKPFIDIYSWGGRVTWKGITFQYKHYCAHPVLSDYKYSEKEGATVYTVESGMLGGNSDQFSIRYSYN